MSYVIYHKETTRLFYIRARSVGCYTDSWKTAGACKATLTREEKKNPEFNRDDYAIAEKADFHANIEKSITKRNPFTGKDITMPINTPACCDPTTETYHSM
jgi:hypothetical protein